MTTGQTVTVVRHDRCTYTLARDLHVCWHGSYGTARRPAHDDRNPSLSVRDGNTGPLFDAVEFIKEYERNGGEVEVDRRGEVQPLGKPGNPTGANQYGGPTGANQQSSEGERNSCNYKDSSPGENTKASYIEARLARDAQTDP
jgi:hypothetical protein